MISILLSIILVLLSSGLLEMLFAILVRGKASLPVHNGISCEGETQKSQKALKIFTLGRPIWQMPHYN